MKWYIIKTISLWSKKFVQVKLQDADNEYSPPITLEFPRSEFHFCVGEKIQIGIVDWEE